MPSCVFFIPEQVTSTIPQCFLTTDDTEYTERKPTMGADLLTYFRVFRVFRGPLIFWDIP